MMLPFFGSPFFFFSHFPGCSSRVSGSLRVGSGVRAFQREQRCGGKKTEKEKKENASKHAGRADTCTWLSCAACKQQAAASVYRRAARKRGTVCMKAGGRRRIRSNPSASRPSRRSRRPSLATSRAAGWGASLGSRTSRQLPDGRTDRRWTHAGVCSGRIRRGGQKQANNKRQR